MKFCTVFITMLVVLAARVSFGQSSTIVKDNFEYADQATFEATWVPAGTVAPLGATLSTEQASSATKSVKIAGTATNGQERNRFTFPSQAFLVGDLLMWSYNMFDTAPAAAPYRQFVNLTDGLTGTNDLVMMGLYNNQGASASGGNYFFGRILGYTPSVTADPDGGPAEATGAAGSQFKLNDFGVGLRSAGWHNLKVVITSDNAAQGLDYYFYVDNQLAEKVLNVGTSLQAFTRIDLGSVLSNLNNAAYYDNMKFSYVAGINNAADFNGDSVTDAADYVIWRTNNGVITSGALQTDGDADADGAVDFDDYLAWKHLYNAVGSPPSESGGLGGAVPEPTAAALAMLSLAMLAGVRRRR